MKILYREAVAEDVPQCAAVFLDALHDLRLRHNLVGGPEPTPAEIAAFHQHLLETGIFHVAVADDEIAAYACAILRDGLWFLCGFWARPSLQRMGIGMPALRGVWDAGRRAGATHYFVWASLDVTAVAAYMKMGMLPGYQVFTFEGTPERLSAPAADQTIEPLEASFAMDVDEVVRGTRRPADHAFFVATGSQGRQVLRGGQRVGYYYLDAGHVGPGAWTQPEHAEVVLAAACREAATAAGAGAKLTLPVPGMNHAALRFALQSGLRLASFNHLLFSAPFGRLEQYIPSGPGLF